jgi:uncharacterized protein YbjT (DUF2867 family)
MSTETRTIAVLGATGAQGSGVVAALKRQDQFRIRALTRDPSRTVPGADETVAADLDEPESLAAAFDGVYGVFANTNSFARPDLDEVAQASSTVDAARAAGVRHYVWSTLPNVEDISGAKYQVPHFTNKAKVNPKVLAAGFEYSSLVEPPFYFQNLISPMYGKQPGPEGTPSWSQPMKVDARGIHMGDISEYGNLVAGVFARPDRWGGGERFSFAGDLLSWGDIVSTLRDQGHDIGFMQAPADEWDSFAPWAASVRHMLEYFEDYTYFGPDSEGRTEAANQATTVPFTKFETWAKENVKPGF